MRGNQNIAEDNLLGETADEWLISKDNWQLYHKYVRHNYPYWGVSSMCIDHGSSDRTPRLVAS